MRILYIKNTKRIRKRKNFLIFQNRDLKIPIMKILGNDLGVGGVAHRTSARMGFWNR